MRWEDSSIYEDVQLPFIVTMGQTFKLERGSYWITGIKNQSISFFIRRISRGNLIHLQPRTWVVPGSAIRSIRKILRALLGQQLVSDETLQTLMSEVEGILNGRPLTPVSSNPKDLDPLTPNHLLLLRANPNLPPGVFSKKEMYSKRRWHQVQYIADVFWRRWLKEYLPTLQERAKWTKPLCNHLLFST